MVPATEQYFSAVREVCNETGALMMVDEVQVSSGSSLENGPILS